MSQPQAALRSECICFSHCPADLSSRLQSQAHRELTHVLLPRAFPTTLLGCNIDQLLVLRTWDAPALLQYTTPEQDDIFQCQKEEWGGSVCRDC